MEEKRITVGNLGKLVFRDYDHDDRGSTSYHLMVNENIIVSSSKLSSLETGDFDHISYCNEETYVFVQIRGSLMRSIVRRSTDESLDYDRLVYLVNDAMSYFDDSTYNKSEICHSYCEYDTSKICCHEYCNDSRYLRAESIHDSPRVSH